MSIRRCLYCDKEIRTYGYGWITIVVSGGSYIVKIFCNHDCLKDWANMPLNERKALAIKRGRFIVKYKGGKVAVKSND